MNRNKPHPLAIAALAVATAGIILTAWASRSLADAQSVYKARLRTLGELASLAREQDEARSGYQAFEQGAATSNQPASLAAAAGALNLDKAPTIGAEKVEPLSGGWSLRRVDVEFSDLALHDAGRFVEFAENQRPPWRLASADITATAPAHGRVKLTFETISR